MTGNRPDVLALGAERLRLQHQVNLRLNHATEETLPPLFIDSPVQGGPYAGAVLDRATFTAAAAELRHHIR